jgi:ribosomal protein S8
MINIIKVIITLQNAIKANKRYFYLPFKKDINKFFEILFLYGLISYVKKNSNSNLLKIGLKFKKNGKLSFDIIKIISKPSNPIFITASECSKITQGIGLFLIFTNKGLKTNQECIKKKLGGKLICFFN